MGKVGRIFIHLAKGTPPQDLAGFGPLITPVQNSFQLSLVLYEMKLVDQNTVIQCSRAIRAALGGSTDRFEEILADAIRRRLVTDQTLQQLGL